jgi:uncharacterized membrane protein
MIKQIKKKRGFWQRVRRFFVTTFIGGLVVVLPITLFVAVLRLIINVLTNIVEPIGELLKFSDDFAAWLVQLISLAIVILGFFLMGLLVRTEFGNKFFVTLEERWLMPLPLYGTIRETVRQFIGRDKMPFSQVVLADVFGGGTLVTGFITDELGNDYYTIFIPTAPNPTNGFVFHVHRSKLKFIDTRSEDALRTVIGLGTGSNVLFNAKEIGLEGEEPLSDE